MKTLMKKVGGCKKARYWNMARFQTRRWHREHAEAAEATNVEPKTANLATIQERTSAATTIPSPACPPQRRASAGGEGQGEGGLFSNPQAIQESNHPPIPPLTPTPIQPLAAPSSSVSSVKSVVEPSSQLPTPHSTTPNATPAPATYERPNAPTAIPSPACPPQRRATAGGGVRRRLGLPLAQPCICPCRIRSRFALLRAAVHLRNSPLRILASTFSKLLPAPGGLPIYPVRSAATSMT